MGSSEDASERLLVASFAEGMICSGAGRALVDSPAFVVEGAPEVEPCEGATTGPEGIESGQEQKQGRRREVSSRHRGNGERELRVGRLTVGVLAESDRLVSSLLNSRTGRVKPFLEGRLDVLERRRVVCSLVRNRVGRRLDGRGRG